MHSNKKGGVMTMVTTMRRRSWSLKLRRGRVGSVALLPVEAPMERVRRRLVDKRDLMCRKFVGEKLRR